MTPGSGCQTKMVATVGPSSAEVGVLARLLAAGVSVFRLNFSHGDHAWHASAIENIRAAEEKAGIRAAILQDLQGPKIRLGVFPEGSVILKKGELFCLTTREIPGSFREASVSYPDLPKDAAPGNRILLNDGLVELLVEQAEGEEVRCRVARGGAVSSHKGVNLPGMKLHSRALTDKDQADLRFGLEHGVDLVALSFVRHPSDLDDVRNLMRKVGRTPPVIAKLEKQEALDHLDDILHKADGVMVARGDLGVEVPFEELPLLQKRIIRKANQAAKPVITATQMLLSMVDHPRPTRAEITDVANAVLDGTDAVMLSEETAVGAFPVETVEAMRLIAAEAEKGIRHENHRLKKSLASRTMLDAVAEAACRAVDDLTVRGVVACDPTGEMARLLSHYRPRVPVYSFVRGSKETRSLNLYWGVVPIEAPWIDDPKERVSLALQEIERRNWIKSGAWVALLDSGYFLKFHQITG